VNNALRRHALTRRSAIAMSAVGAAALTAATAGVHSAVAQEGTPAVAVEPSTGPIPSLTVALIPAEDSEEMLKQFQPLTDYLESELEVEEFELIPALDYSAVIEAMRSGKVDIALFGPFSYVLAHQVANAQALVMVGDADGNPSVYYSLIMANADAGIATLADLPGHSFSFVDPASTSGHLIPRFNLVNNGIDPETDLETIFAGGHDASLLAINEGRVDAGAASEPQYNTMVEEGLIDAANFVELLRSDPIPESPWAYRGDLDPALVERIRQAFLGFHEAVDPEVIAAILDDNGARYVAVEDSLYDPLREVVTVLDLNLEELAG
jgi:phosphonate transport system substrate-binding protein